MSETATMEHEVKPAPAKRPRIGQEVCYWQIDLKVSDPPLAPEKDYCHAVVAGYGQDGNVHLAVLLPIGVWTNRQDVPYSHDPKGHHWTKKN